MSDRETLIQICKIMRRLLLIPYGSCGEIAPRKGTTRHECYRALYEIQELLGTRRLFFSLPKASNADRIRAMTDEELARWINFHTVCEECPASKKCNCAYTARPDECTKSILQWLKQEAADKDGGA